MEQRQVFLKTRDQFGKQCNFAITEQIDEEIMPDPKLMKDYYIKTYRDTGIQHIKQMALHEVRFTNGSLVGNTDNECIINI